MNYTIFGTEHLTSMMTIATSVVIILFVGSRLNSWQVQFFATLMVMLTISVELFDDVYRFMDGHWLLVKDLPLHLCGFSTFLSAYALYTRSQMAFEFSFFWGMGGALQAIITPEFARFYSPYYFYISQISHAIIIINVLWMLCIFKLKIGRYALHRTILLSLILMAIISVINFILGSNYFFVCEKPDVPNPLIIGEWPVYVFFLIIFGSVIMWLLDVAVKQVQKFIGPQN